MSTINRQDRPDYSRYGTSNTVQSLDDLGEAVVRLGSIDRIFRQGNIVIYDDFSKGLSGFDYVYDINKPKRLTLDSKYALYNGYGLSFYGYTNQEYTNTISRNFSLLYGNDISLEFGLNTLESDTTFTATLEVAAKGFIVEYSFIYNAQSGILSYKTLGGTNITIDTLSPSDVVLSGTKIGRLIVDMENIRYKRVTIDNIVYNLDDKWPNLLGSSGATYTKLKFAHYSPLTKSGNFILTHYIIKNGVI